MPFVISMRNTSLQQDSNIPSELFYPDIRRNGIKRPVCHFEYEANLEKFISNTLISLYWFRLHRRFSFTVMMYGDGKYFLKN